VSTASSTTAAFIGDGELHAVSYVKSERALGQCGAQSSDDAVGIYYVPSWAFDGRGMHGDLTVCDRCCAILMSDPDPSGRHIGKTP
jgi:hypothetical protein